MFAKKDRLPRAQFSVALKSGKRASSDHFSLILPHKGVGYAVVIPKKTIRLAANRNRLKRQVLEALRELTLPKALIVFPRFSAGSVKYEDMVAEIKSLLAKID